MRFRPSSLLASAALLALWGCPNFNVPSDTNNNGISINGTNINGNSSAGAGSETTAVSGNTTAHDDAIDEQNDVSWVQQVRLQPGQSPVRFLMTDAPIDADNVFITFCGIRVAPGVDTTKPVQDGSAGAPGAGGSSGVGGASSGGAPNTAEGGSAGAPAPSGGGSAGDKAAAAAEEPTGIGAAGAPSGGTGGAPAADAGVPASNPTSATPWMIISDQCQTLDLLTLQGGVTEAVGLGSLPFGAYGQIRLMITEGSIVKNGLKQPLAISAADVAEGSPVAGGFPVVEGQPITITIDFDAGSSVEYDASQGFVLKPALRVIAVEKAVPNAQPVNGGTSTGGAAGQPSQGTGGIAGSSGQQPPPPGAGGSSGSGDKLPPPPPPPPPSGTAGAGTGGSAGAPSSSGGSAGQGGTGGSSGA